MQQLTVENRNRSITTQNSIVRVIFWECHCIVLISKKGLYLIKIKVNIDKPY